MPFKIVRNDITKIKADAIVNTANPKPVVGGGTDYAVYEAAGRGKLLAARKKIGEIAPGDVASTGAYALDVKYIFHTVGPAWEDGRHGEFDILHSCYEKCLKLARELECESIVFPLLATGSYGFPKDEALQIALAEINRFLLKNDMLVILAVFDKGSFELSSKLLGDIDEYIDEHFVEAAEEEEYADRSAPGEGRTGSRAGNMRMHRSCFGMAAVQKAQPMAAVAMPSMPAQLEDLLNTGEANFQQKLFALIDERGLKDSQVYKRANIDRKVFSSIRCKKNYKPSKKTAVALGIALELNMDEMKDLLMRAELAFSPSSRFDQIISYFVSNGQYDIFEINAVLFDYGEPQLF